MKPDKQEILTSFGYWVRRQRKAADLTQAALAQCVGCARVTIKKIERDERKPSRQLAERLADCLNIPDEDRDRFIRMARGEFIIATISPSAGIKAHFLKHNLPVQSTPFIGREKELVDIIRRLNDPACHLLTLVGPGGVGKTRLAIQAARNLIDTQATEATFAQGIYFVPLAAIRSFGGLISAIAEAVGFTFYSDVSPQQQLLAYLREKAMLLVLDNFEHLLTLEDFLAEIVTAAPAITVLVTSRERLKLREAWVHPVYGMPFPDEGDDGRTMLDEYDAVRLFVQNARRAQVGFSLPAEQQNVASICRLVDGMPLAIELAAAWLELLSCAQIASEIEYDLDFLTTQHKNMPKRHRSMRAIFEHSWRLLAEAEQGVLRKLSVFRGGFDQNAAETIAGASLLILRTLVQKSLLHPIESGRYQLHELLRQFAAEKLKAVSAETEETQMRHSSYYLTFLQDREDSLKSEQQQTALVEIEADIENIGLAWIWAVEESKPEIIEQALPSLYEFYTLRSRYREGQELFAQAVTRLSLELPPAGMAQLNIVRRRLTARQSAFCIYLGDTDTAEALLQPNLTSPTSPNETAFSLWILGEVTLLRGNPTLSQAYLQRSVALNREADNLSGLTDTLARLSFLNMNYFGDYDVGKELAEESVAISRQLGRPDSLARTLDALTWNSICLGFYDKAEAHIMERHALYQKIGEPFGIAASLSYYGWLAVCRNDGPAPEAPAYYEQAITIHREIGHRPYLALALAFLAHAYYELGMYEKALSSAYESVTLADKIGNLEEKIFGYCWLGAVEGAMGDVQNGQQHLIEALETAYTIRGLPHSTFILLHLGVLLAMGDDVNGVTEAVNMQNKTKALELFTLVRNHPATWQIFKNKAALLQAKLQLNYRLKSRWWPVSGEETEP